MNQRTEGDEGRLVGASMAVAVFIAAAGLLSVYFTAIFWSPAVDFTQFEGTQSEQIDQAREDSVALSDEMAAVDEAAEQIADAQATVADDNPDTQATDSALTQAAEAVESVEDALTAVPDRGGVAAEVFAAEEALISAQEAVADAGTDPDAAEEAIAEVSDAVEAAEDAVESVQDAVELSATAEVLEIITAPPEPTIRVLWMFDWKPNAELLQLFLAMGGAGIGSSAGSLIAMTTWVGKREFERSWNAWYLTRPLWSIGVAIIGYAAIRGGLLNINNDAAVLNPFAVFAIGAMFGMRATDSFHTIADLFKRPGTNRRDNAGGSGEKEEAAPEEPAEQ